MIPATRSSPVSVAPCRGVCNDRSSALIGVVLWSRLPVISWRRWRAGRHAVIVGLPIGVVARALCLRTTSDGARERARAGADGGTPTAACYGADAGAQQSTAKC